MASYDTIVIGLGAAGCQAASTLAEAGRRVLGLEAQGRVGGRVYTVPFGEGVVELGGEWIHGTVGNRVYDIAMKSKIQLVNQFMSHRTFMSDGKETRHELATEVIMLILQSDLSSSADDDSGRLGDNIVKFVNEYFAVKCPEVLKDEQFMTEFFQVLELLMNNLNASNSWNDVTSQTSQGFLDGCWHVSWHSLGYETLFDILLNKHNGGPGYPNLDVKLNAEVTHVQWSHDSVEKVKVTTKDGMKYTADNVIVTLSVGVLKECHHSLFTPKLPDEKIKAMEHISIGVMDKIIMYFDEVWWKGDQMFNIFQWRAEDKRKVGREDYWTTRILGVSSPSGSRNTVTFWTSGEVAKVVETLPEEEVRSKLMELLRKFLGSYIGKIPEPTDMIRSTWNSNPYTRGSYTYENVQSPLYPTARTDLGSPVLDSRGNPRLLFAGEATDKDNYGTVHGAADSGHREANRILQSKEYLNSVVIKSKY